MARAGADVFRDAACTDGLVGPTQERVREMPPAAGL